MNFAYTRMGTRLQTVIHHVLDATPMPQRLRTRLKNCPGCDRRRDLLDRLTTPPKQPDDALH